ncbi:LacI family transcriptional regulator [Pullulanibacillus camelliae]|uniref:LacI family transcriptional regulator n=1 Tax=Pullulanibacillus camelliae TaxID=1707096 RepID=A0A8J2VL85_9BACL|nr:LacI family DNA-binding transcriptional regulator [Pullulanibacillus camelliae]GGE27864.1 LacI family transcriptional regulator [Pullulanibacillus camelliae]
MTTIRDIAKAAEVSVATVSRVLNNNGYVHVDTRARVLKIIKEFNYRPNAVARSLYKKQSNTIALILPDITNPFFPELAKAVEDALNLYGYTLMLCNSDERPLKEREYVEILKQKYVDGVILVSHTLAPEDLERLGLPVVIVDRNVHGKIPTVLSNNIGGARRGTRFLKEKGYKVIAHLRGPENIVTSNERYQGYLDVVADESWFHEGLTAVGNYNMKESVTATKELITKYPEIDAIFSGNDVMGVGAVKAVQEMGKQIPDDIGIIGFDGITLGEMIYPELTTIAQPIYEMGVLAARMLIKLIENKPLNTTFYEFPIKLIERKTTR